MEQLSDGLERIDKSHLTRKLKAWCYQFTLYQWLLKLREITTSTVLRMDAKANHCIRNWLGFSQSLSNIGMFGKATLQLPLRSINLGYGQEKARLVLELRDSTDPFVKNTKALV